VSGLLTIQIAPPGIRVSQPWRYRASIRLSGAEFVGPTGTRVRVAGPFTLTAWVGSLGGADAVVPARDLGCCISS
jgi:hypothetical protein